MKKIFILTLWLLSTAGLAGAQDNNGYFLMPGPSKTLAPGTKFQLFVQHTNTAGSPELVNAPEILKWTINGHDVTSQNPAEGSLGVDLALATATYTAPVAAPAHNPVAIAVTVKGNSDSKAVMILICNVTILSAQYKITADFKATGPEGIDYSYKGECYTNLKALADGTFMLAPVDNGREMDLTIEKAAMTSYTTFIGPKSYKIPFLFTINKMDAKHPAPALARLALVTVCPLKGKVQWVIHGGGQNVNYTCDIDKGLITYSPGGTTIIPGTAGRPFAMNGVTNLDILQYFAPATAEGTLFTNQVNAYDIKQFAQRIQAHSGDPNYFKTAQGKADLQKMQAMQQQLGNKTVHSTGEAALLHVANTTTPPSNNPYTKMMPGMARIRVQDMFDSKSSEAFNGSTEGAVGPIKASITVKVEKLK
ncbi:MAG TPA: hypothetical protein VGN20_22050 [Mucilaginibacter sp.]|jgi:hypothetical protein